MEISNQRSDVNGMVSFKEVGYQNPKRGYFSTLVSDAEEIILPAPSYQSAGSLLALTKAVQVQHLSNGGHVMEAEGLPPLMLPNVDTLNGLRAQISEGVKAMLQANGMKAAPAFVHFNGDGSISMPDDYAEKDAFEAALKADKNLFYDMRSLNAVTLRYVSLQTQVAYYEGVNAAENAEHAETLIANYKEFIASKRELPVVDFLFSADGNLQMSVDTETMDFAPLIRHDKETSV